MEDLALRVKWSYPLHHPDDNDSAPVTISRGKHGRAPVAGVLRHYRRWKARLWTGGRRGRYVYLGTYATRAEAEAVTLAARERREPIGWVTWPKGCFLAVVRGADGQVRHIGSFSRRAEAEEAVQAAVAQARAVHLLTHQTGGR